MIGRLRVRNDRDLESVASRACEISVVPEGGFDAILGNSPGTDQYTVIWSLNSIKWFRDTYARHAGPCRL